MWHDDPFSQKNKATKRAVGSMLGGWMFGQNLKKGGA